MPLVMFHRTAPQRDENVSRRRGILTRRNAPTWRGYFRKRYRSIISKILSESMLTHGGTLNSVEIIVLIEHKSNATETGSYEFRSHYTL